MPSLQQTSFKDWPSPDIARSLTGPDILQKHSINSLLLEHNEIISRGLPSPIEENVSFSDILGSSQSSQSTSTSSLLGTNGNNNNSNSSSNCNNGSNITHSVSINCSGKGSAGHSNHHHLQHQPTLASFSSLSSLGGGGPDSASSILSSSLSGGTTTGSSPSVGGNPFNFGGLSMSNSSLNSPELGNGGGGGGSSSTGGGGGQSPTYYGNGLHSTSSSAAKNYEDFRFDNDISLSGSTATGGVGANSLTSEALKLLQRNMAGSYDCSLPTSPNAVSSSSSSSAAAAAAAAGLCARYFRGTQQLNDLSHNNSNNNGSSNNSNNNGYHESSLFGGHHQSLSRSNSPPDNDSSLLANFDSTNILDMISYLTISQQQQQQHQQNNQHYGSNSSSSNNGGSSHSPYGGANLNQFYQQQHQQNGGGGCGGGSMSSFGGNNGNCNSNNNSQSSNCGGTGFTSSDYERLQNLQALNALRLLQQQSQQLSQFQQYQQFNQLVPNYGGNSQLKNWPLQNSPPSSSGSSGGNDINLDRIARFHRSSAAHYDATCTWSGVLPPRSHRLVTYSSKIFLGGMPWDISEQSLVQIFKPFGSIKVEWPGKEQQATQPKGYVYIIFESDKQVKALLQACTYTYTDGSSYNGSSRGGGGGNSPLSVNNAITGGGGDDQQQQLQLVQQQSGQQQLMLPNKLLPTSGARINFKISSKRIKSKDVEVIPWNIADSNYVKSTSQKLDPTKTVFVGALHGQLTAEGLAQIMNDLFDGVVYVGIDTDKYKYPLGSARVTFNNSRSYMKAVVAAFIEIKTAKFTKKLQVDPYLEDSLCSMCSVQHGPYFCREIVCFRYFCRSCWQFQHNRDTSLQNHKPLTRNSKSTTIIGVGPQQQQGGGGGSQHQQQNHHSYSSQLNYHHHQNHQQQMHQQHHSHYHGGSLHGSPKSPSPSCTTTSTSSSADSSPVSCHGPANLHQQLQQQFGSL